MHIVTESLAKLFLFLSIYFVSLSISSNPFLEELESKTFPTADEAFIFEISEKNEDSMILTWSLKENCFLYKEKFKLIAEGKEISSFQIIGEPNKINDVYFGEVEVYFDSVSIILNLNEGEKEIDISYQGCNEKGFCYPPIEKKLLLDKNVKF